MTEQFMFTVGVAPGYFSDARWEPMKALDIVSEAWGKAAEEMFLVCGTYPTAVAHPGVAVYRTQWGCPEGGEAVVTLMGIRNPEFADPLKWRQAVEGACRLVADRLGQKKTYLAFHDVDFIYIKAGE